MSGEFAQLEAEQTAEQAGLLAQSIDFVRGHAGLAFTAVGLAGSLMVTGCAGHGSAEAAHPSSPAATSSAPGETPSPSTSASTSPNKLPSGSLKLVTDTKLANGGYNCGHTINENLKTGYDYTPQIAYLNANEAVKEAVKNFQINDPTWGMGQDAFNVVAKYAYDNPNTPEATKVVGDDQMNTYAHKVTTFELPDQHNYVNFTCKDGTVTAVSYVGIKTTNHVNGVVFDKAGLTKFEDVVRKDAKGKMIFDVIDMGKQKINGKDVDLSMVVTEAEGCNNPERVIPEAIEKQLVAGKTVTPSTPEASPTPTTPVTPTTPGQPTPSPSVTPTPQPSFPKKVPVPISGPNPQKGSGGSGGASCEPGCDSPVTGYGPGQQPTEAPAPVVTETPAPVPSGVETGDPTPPTVTSQPTEAPSAPPNRGTTPPQPL